MSTPSQPFNITLNDQDFFLLQFAFQSLFQFPEEPTGRPLVGSHDKENDDLIAVGHITHLPESFIGLWEERDAVECLQQLFPHPI